MTKTEELEQQISHLRTKVDEMTITLEKAKEKLFEQRDMLEALTREPLSLATVIKTYLNDPRVWAENSVLKDRDALNRDKYGTAVLYFEGRLVEVLFCQLEQLFFSLVLYEFYL